MNQKELIEKINKVSNIIQQKNIKENADYIIVSPKVAEMIENLDIKNKYSKILHIKLFIISYSFYFIFRY